jgi:hypothetical protein
MALPPVNKNSTASKTPETIVKPFTRGTVFNSRKWKYSKYKGTKRFYNEIANELNKFDLIPYGDLASKLSTIPNFKVKGTKGPIRSLYRYLKKDYRLKDKIIDVDKSNTSKNCNNCRIKESKLNITKKSKIVH